jgi:hypothetical protein
MTPLGLGQAFDPGGNAQDEVRLDRMCGGVGEPDMREDVAAALVTLTLFFMFSFHQARGFFQSTLDLVDFRFGVVMPFLDFF